MTGRRQSSGRICPNRPTLRTSAVRNGAVRIAGQCTCATGTAKSVRGTAPIAALGTARLPGPAVSARRMRWQPSTRWMRRCVPCMSATAAQLPTQVVAGGTWRSAFDTGWSCVVRCPAAPAQDRGGAATGVPDRQNACRDLAQQRMLHLDRAAFEGFGLEFTAPQLQALPGGTADA